MIIRIIAHTTVAPYALREAYGYDPLTDPDGTRPTDADALSVAAGRLCYLSFDRPNPATANAPGYLANILAQHHESVLEHASVTFLVRRVSRALLAELTRHRHLSFSVVSQRYVDYSTTSPVIPPALNGDERHLLEVAYEEALETYDDLVTRLRARGLGRKQAREAARAVLPNAAPVDMVVTGNLRAWRDVLRKRHHIAADAEIQEFARRIRRALVDIAPGAMQDIPDDPFGSDG